MMKRLIQLSLAAAALAGAGCGNESRSETESAVGTTDRASKGKAGLAAAKPKPAATGTTIAAASSQFGNVLFSKSKRAIYYFDKETGRAPECYGECARAWPPVLTSGRPHANHGARTGLLGTTQRANGRKQVTYRGHPLYFYVNDPKGEVTCHNVDEFGGLWLSVKPNGAPVS